MIQFIDFIPHILIVLFFFILIVTGINSVDYRPQQLKPNYFKKNKKTTRLIPIYSKDGLTYLELN